MFSIRIPERKSNKDLDSLNSSQHYNDGLLQRQLNPSSKRDGLRRRYCRDVKVEVDLENPQARYLPKST